MSLIVAARFETFEAAEGAAAALMREGITEDALHTFFVNPAGAHDRYPVGGDRALDPGSQGAFLGSVTGAAVIGLVGAVIGAIIGSLVAESVLPITVGAGAGAYIGSLLGAVVALGRPRPDRTPRGARVAQKNEGRSSGVLLAVHTHLEQERRVAQMLRDAGGVEVERAQGRWREGKWVDFDPLTSPEPETN